MSCVDTTAPSTTKLDHFKTLNTMAEKTTQALKNVYCSSRGPDFDSHHAVQAFKTAYNACPKGSDTFFWIPLVNTYIWFTYIHAVTHRHI